MPGKVLTVGYQKRTGKELAQLLSDADVDVLVDIRESAWSYRPEFRRTALAERLEAEGISYVHARFAGNPKRNLKKTATHRECLNAYRDHVESTPEVLEDLSGLLVPHLDAGLRVCLLCYERHPEDCHRSILLDEWQRGTGIQVTINHLDPDGADRFLEG